jgi:anti-sigma regulatory factor (Ser/Thr protein kinase)
MQQHWRLPGDPLSVRRARELARSLVAKGAVTAATAEAAVLVVSELVSNAIVHAASEVELDIDTGPGGVHVTVHDDSPDAPMAKGSLPHDPGGRGLAIVDQLADRWGWTSVEGNGKEVWCELLPDHPPAGGGPARGSPSATSYPLGAPPTRPPGEHFRPSVTVAPWV